MPSVVTRLLIAVPFILLVSAFTLSFDRMFADTLLRQHRAASLPSVVGTITRSEVQVSRGHKNSLNHDFVIRYTYEVDGLPYEGSQVRYPWNNDTADSMRRLATRYPRGAQVPVFYRPEDPREAVLKVGLEGTDLLCLMFMMMFNSLMVAAWILGVRFVLENSGVRTFERKGRTHVRLPAMAPGIAGLFAMSGAMLLGAVAWFTGAQPSMTTALLLWAAVGGVGVASTVWQGARLRTGRRDLILDEQARQLSLPVTRGRKEQLHVPWSQVVAAIIETREIAKGTKGYKKVHRLMLELVAPSTGSRREFIAEWAEEEKALALASWLRSRLKLFERPTQGQQSA
jgi:hypothetical protein